MILVIWRKKGENEIEHETDVDKPVNDLKNCISLIILQERELVGNSKSDVNLRQK